MPIDQLKRREFITLLGGAVAAWPVVTHAQQPGMPVIGFRRPDTRRGGISAGLGEAGFVENRNVAFEFRWADGQFDRLPGLAADLAGRKVAIIARMRTGLLHPPTVP
jgi:putative ABC transport system substrate-binding protein